MWQAERWNSDPTYKPVMIVQPDHIFLRDFVLFQHPYAGCTIGQIESFFVDISHSTLYACTGVCQCTFIVKGQKDEELSAIITPLYNVWQYSCVSKFLTTVRRG